MALQQDEIELYSRSWLEIGKLRIVASAPKKPLRGPKALWP
jgi:hypothetical protein